MRKIITFFCLYLSMQVAFAQSRNVDSLKNVLSKTTGQLERFKLINEIFEGIFINGNDNLDSASCIEMLAIAQELNNDSLLATSYNMVAGYFFLNTGDNTTALEYLFKAIPLAEKAKDKRRISSLYFDIAYVYAQLQNLEAALKFNRKGAENLPERSSPKYDFLVRQYQDNMANCFLLLKQPDSALHYTQQLNETNLRYKSRNYDVIALRDFAGVYDLLGDTALAGVYYKKAIVLVDSISNYYNKFHTKSSYGNFLLKSNKITEARVQATQLFDLGARINNNDMKLAGAGLLRRVFEKLHQIDSAYYYSRVEAEIGDAIFSQDNVDKIQALAFNEKLRVMEEADRQADEASQRKRHIQYALLAFGIVIFIILFLLLSRSFITNTKVIEFLSIIALLLVFEFLNLLLHPFLERITDHSPVLMLLGLVCVAALLVPLHHKAEKWATSKLVEKNKKMRLAAAKKTIEELEKED